MAAEAILSNIAAEIIAKLGSILLREIGLFRGLKKDLKKLKSRVTTIQAVLLDAEKKYYSESHQVKDWLDKLKQAMYDADDLLDDFSTAALRKELMTGNRFVKQVRTFFSSSNQVVYGLEMAHKVNAITKRLNKIADERKFHLDVCLKEVELVRERTQTHSSVPDVVVGRDDDKNKILELLFSTSTYDDASVSLPVICIWGIGGLGKTTLAQQVFNDEKVQREFDFKLWVCVSINFDVKLIVENILEQITKERPKDLQMNTLKDNLQEKLNDKRYLLVLDDIWNDDFHRWSALKDLLKGGTRDSVVLVTARSRRVAEITSTAAQYELKGLSEVESWDLFIQMALKPGQELISPNHETIGKEILAKCAGVPLAIKTIGKMLYFKGMNEWLAFRDKELSQLGQQETDILPTLKLSYDNLPSHLKHCFAFCSLYPKDCIIDVQRLVGLWIAGGFIKPKEPNECLEDVGFDYCKDLLWRSFFQEAGTDRYGNIRFCKMHDLMHDLSKQMSGKECVVLDSDIVGFDESPRHLSLGIDCHPNFMLKTFPHLLKENKIQTVMLPGDRWSDTRRISLREWQQYQEFFANLRNLRILDLNGFYIENLPRFIHKMKHLRYLDLSENGSIEFLPHFITKLPNLQILNLNYCKKLKELPSGLTKLANLRQLHLKKCNDLSHMPRGLGKLVKLQVLSKFVVGDNTISSGRLAELRDLSNLRGKLQILNLRMVTNPEQEFAAANLKAKEHLQCLEFSWNQSGYESDGDEISMDELQPHVNLVRLIVRGNGRLQLPSWLSTLTNLVDLWIINCRTGQRISSLDRLPSLKKLKLYQLHDLEYIEISSAFPFPSLEELSLGTCQKLKGWLIKTPTTNTKLLEFPCLSKLGMFSCQNITWIPSSFPSLRSLKLNHVNAKVVISIVESTISSSSSAPSFANSSLESFAIVCIDDLEVLPEDMLRHLVSLEKLHIHSCHKLRTLSQEAMKYCTSLKDIKISFCKQLNFPGDGLEWQHLKNLRSVEIRDIPKLESLPVGLKHITTLRKLVIKDTANLKPLRDWVDSLKELKISSMLKMKENGMKRK